MTHTQVKGSELKFVYKDLELGKDLQDYEVSDSDDDRHHGCCGHKSDEKTPSTQMKKEKGG